MEMVDLLSLLVMVPIALLFAGLMIVVLGVVFLGATCAVLIVAWWLLVSLFRTLFVSDGGGRGQKP